MNIALALLLTLFAGLSTTIGGLLGVVLGRPSPGFMSVSLGFSAGVMVWVAFMELLAEGMKSIGPVPAYLGLFIGMVAMFLVDVLIPHDYMAEHVVGAGQCQLPNGTVHDRGGQKQGVGGQYRHRHGAAAHAAQGKNYQILKCGAFVALGMAIHNFPEGLATFAGGVQNASLGAAIALAISIHNIPEGLAVSAPMYAATGDRRQAFLWSFLPGLTEPAGAALAALFLFPFLNATVLGWMLSLVAGIMIFISLDELVPVACSFGENHASIIGVAMGMAVMATSLQLLHG